MKPEIVRGNGIAEKIRSSLKRNTSRTGPRPLLAAVRVGKNKASEFYAKKQQKNCLTSGIDFKLVNLSEKTTEKKLVSEIRKLNNNSRVSGIIVFVPLPGHINTLNIHNAIAPEKDVEGVTPSNLGLLVRGQATFMPCTALAVMKILETSGINPEGKECVIIGSSDIIGKPLTLMLLLKMATVTVCHIKTRDISIHTKKADILVVAAGKKNLVRGNMIKKGAAVIDVGFNVSAKGISGDVCFREAVKKASLITPVPGGIGPVTTAMLMENTLKAFLRQKTG